MTPENAASEIVRPAELTPENAALLFEYAIVALDRGDRRAWPGDGKLAGDNAGHALELMHAARERLRA